MCTHAQTHLPSILSHTTGNPSEPHGSPSIATRTSPFEIAPLCCAEQPGSISSTCRCRAVGGFPPLSHVRRASLSLPGTAHTDNQATCSRVYPGPHTDIQPTVRDAGSKRMPASNHLAPPWLRLICSWKMAGSASPASSRLSWALLCTPASDGAARGGRSGCSWRRGVCGAAPPPRGVPSGAARSSDFGGGSVTCHTAIAEPGGSGSGPSAAPPGSAVPWTPPPRAAVHAAFARGRAAPVRRRALWPSGQCVPRSTPQKIKAFRVRAEA